MPSTKAKPARAPERTVYQRAGDARAASLTPEQRKEIASKAASERWAKVKDYARETHSGVLHIGDRTISCSVLSDGKRVLSVSGLEGVFLSNRRRGLAGNSGNSGGTAQLPAFLASDNIKPFISADLAAALSSPIGFTPKRGGRAFGFEATLLPDMCSTLLDARGAGSMRPSQLGLAVAAEALLRAFAKVGVVALVDEATGYQADRARDELQRLLDAYVAEEMRPWVKLFPDEFFKQTYRLHGWVYQAGNNQGPRYVGKWINKYIYSRLPAEVLEELRTRNPAQNGQRRYKHHQFLTGDIGHPALDRHLNAVTTLMRASRDKAMFIGLFGSAFAVPGTQAVLAVPDDDDKG